MSIEENKKVAQSFIDAIQRSHAAAVREVCAADLAQIVIENWIPMRDRRWGDRTLEIAEMVAEGERVWGQLADNGRQIGEWLGLPATGKPSSGSGVGFMRLSGGKGVEFRQIWDELRRGRQHCAKLALAE